jgi:LmbE family N-acetylglucosaminyl deacetylase
MANPNLDRRSFLTAAPAAGLLLSSQAAAAEEPEKKKLTLMFVGAHRDDAEIGAGGVILKALAAGHRVVMVQAVSDFSNWPNTMGREAEVTAADEKNARALGVEKILLGYKYHHVPVDNEIKKRIAQVYNAVKPDIAFIQAETDNWTDHANTSRAGKDGILFAHGYLSRPIKRIRQLLAYPVTASQTYEFQPDVFVDISDVIERVTRMVADLDTVTEGKRKIVSTMVLHGAQDKTLELTGHGERVVTSARRWGEMCGVHFAQAFRSIVRAPQQLW